VSFSISSFKDKIYKTVQLIVVLFACIGFKYSNIFIKTSQALTNVKKVLIDSSSFPVWTLIEEATKLERFKPTISLLQYFTTVGYGLLLFVYILQLNNFH